jgi:hypothetical protein
MDWPKPTLGAVSFGALMYASMAVNARDNPLIFGLVFIGVAVGAALVSFRPMSRMARWGFYIFAGCSVVFGIALLSLL